MGLAIVVVGTVQLIQHTPFSLLSGDLAMVLIGLGIALMGTVPNPAIGPEKNSRPVAYYVAMLAWTGALILSLLSILQPYI